MKGDQVTVCCKRCGERLRVRFGRCLATGWPICHGQTMELVDAPRPRIIDVAVKELVAEVLK